MRNEKTDYSHFPIFAIKETNFPNTEISPFLLMQSLESQIISRTEIRKLLLVFVRVVNLCETVSVAFPDQVFWLFGPLSCNIYMKRKEKTFTLKCWLSLGLDEHISLHNTIIAIQHNLGFGT